jgi:predicted glutamine amidotransferase
MNTGRSRFLAVIGAAAAVLLLFASSACGPAASTAHQGTSLAAADHACRFWCIISSLAPAPVIRAQLGTDPNSLKALSHANPNGWGVGYYSGNSAQPVVIRGQNPAYSDALFDAAVAQAAGAQSRIVVSHVRHSSSGLSNISNPHPFERVTSNGSCWLMGHNGTIDKTILLSLIRPDYLAANPPVNGSNLSEWIDSELYFMFMLQTIQDYNYDVKAALGHVIQCLRAKLPATGEPLNFFLTDGATLWAYRQGNSLYYLYNPSGPSYSIVASQYTSPSQGSWITMTDGQLVTMTQTGAPVVENITKYFSPPSITVTSPNGGQSWVAGTKHAVTWSVANLSGYVKIQLLKSGSPVRTITSSCAAGSGSCMWSIPFSQSSGSDYRVRITSTSNTGVSDTSDASFSITSH